MAARLASCESETVGGNVDGASDNCATRDKVDDRCQNDSPSKRITRHTVPLRLLP
jgi:hypothetical protein